MLEGGGHNRRGKAIEKGSKILLNVGSYPLAPSTEDTLVHVCSAAAWRRAASPRATPLANLSHAKTLRRAIGRVELGPLSSSTTNDLCQMVGTRPCCNMVRHSFEKARHQLGGIRSNRVYSISLRFLKGGI